MDEFEDLTRTYSDKRFGRRIGFGTRPVLLIVDFIRAFTDEASLLGGNFKRELEETNRLLAAARRFRVPRIFTTVAYEPDLRDAGLWRIKSPSDTLITGTPAVEIDPVLERRPEETILVKKFASAFFGTHLLSLLHTQAIDTILVAGCTTSGCVRATVVDGLSYGFRMIVAREAVGDRATITHRVSLADMDAKYGDVVPVDEVLGYIERVEQETAQ